MNNLRVVIRQTQKVVTTKKELTTDKVTSEQKVDLKIWDFNTEKKFNQKLSLLAIVNGTYAIVEREKKRKKEGLRPFNPIQISKPLEIMLDIFAKVAGSERPSISKSSAKSPKKKGLR